jgi:hypothetical protein
MPFNTDLNLLMEGSSTSVSVSDSDSTKQQRQMREVGKMNQHLLSSNLTPHLFLEFLLTAARSRVQEFQSPLGGQLTQLFLSPPERESERVG